MYANSYYNDMPGKEKKRGGGRGGPRADAGPPAAAPGPAPVAAVARTAGTDGPAGGPPQAAPAQRPMFDPALDPERRPRMTDMVRNIDIGAGAFNVDFEYDSPAAICKRPGLNMTGKGIQLLVNAYPITSFPTKNVQQYDILIGSGTEKRAVIDKVWRSRARKQLTGPATWIFDGNKLAWSLKGIKEGSVTVDLDQEEGRPPGKTPNIFKIVIRPTKLVNLTVINAFLNRQTDFTNDTLEALNFLDHLLRESPSKNPDLIAIKRSFFSKSGEFRNLGNCVEAWKGVYQSIKCASPGRLIVNLDVSNTCFWAKNSLVITATNLFQCRDPQQLNEKLKAPQPANRNIESRDFAQLKRLHKLRVTAKYRGCPTPDKEWTIKHFLNYDAKSWTTPMMDPATGERKEVTIYDYFKMKYAINLQYWQLPLVQMTKKGIVYPMELVGMFTSQKYNYKLTELQTAEMIKFAVAPPKSRMDSINVGKGWLNWGTDPVLQDFGLRIDPNMIKSNARLLPNPEIEFGGRAKTNPGTFGKWDLRGKKFFGTNTNNELKSWGIGVFPGGRVRVDQAQIEAFADKFRNAYVSHGGKVASRPLVKVLENDAARAVENLHQSVGNHFNQRPQLLIFLVQDRNAFHYTRIKKSCDCRFGVMSQVMQLAQVMKGSPQYISNVLMKVNAKLGGTTSKTVSKIVKDFPVPTMLIGADVSHASPGSPQASMAAMTMSLDRFGGRYAAACETNGHRVEIISQPNVRKMLFPMVNHWAANVGGGRLPQQVIYFRDGVSEGQFQHVIKQEVPYLKEVFQKIGDNKWNGKIAVVIASKRHHVRAFPNPGDRNASDQKGNPLPGALIEQDVTHPFEWDFYLWSHIALQGTSRPVHYQVIYDEIGLPHDKFHNLIYEHCYQYMRSTTAVSLFPAVYYAHLASNRARAHENIAADAGPQTGPGIKLTHTSSDDKPETEAKPLMPLHDNVNKIQFGMWYI